MHNHITQGSGTEGNVILLIESPGFQPEHYDAITGEMPAHAGDVRPAGRRFREIALW